MSRIQLLAVTLVIATMAPSPPCRADDESLAVEAGKVLRRHCYRCHRGAGSESGYAFDVTDTESLIAESMVVAEDAENSDIYKLMFEGRMPPRNRPQLPRPSAEEIASVKRWIEAGAPPIPEIVARPTRSLRDELTAIRADLRDRRRDDRFSVRYFTLTHLHNNSRVDAELLGNTRLALAKTLNSLSWQPLLVAPQPIDDAQTIYAVDLNDLGWTREHWNTLVRSYPYAFSFGSHDDEELAEIDRDIQDLRGADRTPVAIRADWMIAVATKPPLYYALMFDLALPELQARKADTGKPANPKQMTDSDLEKFLGVDVLANIRRDDTWRSGFTESGVSGQNRMIERHAIQGGGYYWKSYDFASSNRTAVLSEFPLGPRFEGNRFADLAFEHDGGEMIFSLPNGLQGYLLANAAGERIDAGPIEIVADSLRTSGNEQIVGGISCIACHRTGMIEAPEDEVRTYAAAVGEAREQVRRLYPEGAEFNKLLKRDGTAFVRAMQSLAESMGVTDDVASLPEPVGEVARWYHLEPMRAETVAAELYVSPERLRQAVEADPRLHRLGLRILLRKGGSIKRAAWESPATFPLVKQAARQFGFDPR